MATKLKAIKRISDLLPDDRNANRGTERGNAFIERSLREYGAGRSILIDRKGKIIAGNKTVENAAAVGLDGLLVVQSDGTKIVAVQRTDLDMDRDPRARELALADNRSGDLNLEWDGSMLAELGKDIDLEPFFSTEELAEIIGKDFVPAAASEAPEAQIDRAEQLREKWQTAEGQIWATESATLKGKAHRLMCGDSATQGDVARLLAGCRPILMVTDPPYGVEYDPNWRNEAAEKGLISYAARSIGTVQNDDRVNWGEVYRLFNAQVAYVWHAGRHAKEVQQSLEDAGYEIISQIIWAKPMFAISRGDYHWQHEPCWYAHKKGDNHNWQGARDQSTLWKIERGCKEKTGHGTEKPIECMQQPMRNNTCIGQVVADPFVGSGTSLCAAEQIGRLCYGMEINPSYVAICLQRMHDMGLQPKLAA